MVVVAITIKCKYIYNTHWQASYLPRLFLSARGGSLSVGGVVLRSDALARALIPKHLTLLIGPPYGANCLSRA